MKLKLRENADINVVTGISDIIIDSINKKWDNIRDLNSIIVNLNEEGFEELVPVIESILEDENKNVGKLQQLVELISPTAKSIDDGRQEAIDELDNNEEIKVEEMKLDENFSNVPEETTTTVDPTFGKAIEDKEEDEKIIEDALKENEKLAKETIPKEGDTGKKVTSPALKAMHLSESLFDEDLNFEDRNDFVHELYRAVFQVVKKWEKKASWHDSELTMSNVESGLDEVFMHLQDDDELELNESLNKKKVNKVNFDLDNNLLEGISAEKAKQLYQNLSKIISEKEKKHEFKVSKEDRNKFIKMTLKMILMMMEYEEKTNSKISPEELMNLGSRLFDNSFNSNGTYTRDFEESLKYDIAKEQIKKFKEGKMPKDWSSEDYINDLINKKHLTKEEGDRLLSEGVEDLNSKDEFRSWIKMLLSDMKQAYHLLLNDDKDSFDLAENLVDSCIYDMQVLSESMKKFNQE